MKKVLCTKGEGEVTSRFRGKGRINGGGHLLNESHFDWSALGAS